MKSMRSSKNIMSFNKYIYVLILSLAIGISVNSQDIVIWPSEISFNYESGNAIDAITIRENYSTAIIVPEYKPESNRNAKFAYIKGQSGIKIKVKFKSNVNNVNFVVKATVIEGYGIGDICDIFVSNCDLDNTIFTISLNTTIQEFIGLNTFKWKWEALALPINSPYCMIQCEDVITQHTYYSLFAQPVYPMNIPWTKVLDYACEWAQGKSTESDLVKYVTIGAFNNIGKHYNPNHSYAYLPNFDLTNFLADTSADCQDMSAVVQVFSNALGSANIKVRSIDMEDYVGFFYKPVHPIGWTPPVEWTDDDDIVDYWHFHQFGYMNGVYDACIELVKTNHRIAVDEEINGSYKNDLLDCCTWQIDDITFYKYVR
ncbi:MAG: hypothetical protein U0T82_09540 [Bacteroidales bacterium]